MPDTVPVPDRARVAAEHYFGERLSLAVRYADLLATDGVLRGLIGPREVPRLWERHLLNSAALIDVVPSGATLVDVGSGAGLPGLVLAIAEPSLRVVLVEPQLRRTTFLQEVIGALDLGHVTVVRARAEEAVRRTEPADVVVARAVAPLDRLAAWCLPLVRVDGRLLALKGASAADEIATHSDAVQRAGGAELGVVTCGVGFLDPPATVVTVVRERETVSRAQHLSGGSRARRRRRHQ